ncbi:CU044_5270 family protein [Sphaerisporangium sp. B11E5]|uniref:CU044_5270 family protein n=1 Tax=Sphaerisporangium sp. B11E5 TaxID=3153563 RepID=UPI00325E201D
MNDLDLIRDLRSEVPDDPAALASARERLLAAMTTPPGRRRPPRGTPLRVAPAAPRRRPLPLVAVAAAVVTGVVVAWNAGVPAPAGPGAVTTEWTPAAGVESLAARATAAAEGTDMYPGPGQWLYIKGLTYQPERGPGSTQTHERWTKGDGTQTARRSTGADHPGAPRPIGSGGLVTSPTAPGHPRWDPAYLRTLPLSPGNLAARLRADREPSPPGVPEAVTAFMQIQLLLQEASPPPRLRAALYTVLSRLPGIALEDRVRDLTGREGVGVYLDRQDGTRHEIIVDPSGYTYLGGRSLSPNGETIAAWTELTRGVVTHAGDVP